MRLLTGDDKSSKDPMEKTIPADKTPISWKKAAQERKLQEKRERDREYYLKNREKKVAQVKERRREKRDQSRPSSKPRSQVKRTNQKEAAKERRQIGREDNQKQREKAREQTRERVCKYRERQKQQEVRAAEEFETRDVGEEFRNRTSKKRATDKVKKTLPSTPVKKVTVLERLVNSPRTRKLLSERRIVTTLEEQKELTTLRALASDISAGLQEVKSSGSNEKRAAFKAFKTLAFGEKIKNSRAKRSLRKLVKLDEKSISRAIKRRESILKGDTACWLYTKRKVRQDAISEEDTKKVFNYWAPTASRPTGDKNDSVKKRIGKKEYVRHAKHVLEQTQTDAFREFQQMHPEVKIQQRKFESLKPFFVKQAKERDRKSCLRRKHVEMQIVFNACMKFQRGVLNKSGQDDSLLMKYVTEASEKTLCPKPDGSTYHSIECLERTCADCGIDKLVLLPEEISVEGTVTWSRYEYVSTGKLLANGQEKKKIALVQKETPPSELFGYFKELLVEYPSHSFMAKWQGEQLDSLLENLPLRHVVCIHNYSGGYACRQQDEIQSEYFDIAKVSLHVTILHCHAVEAVDGVDSTKENPHLVKEHVFVISDDPVQNQDSVHKCQELISKYLQEDLGYKVERMHEFTDGCAVQPNTSPGTVLVTCLVPLLTLAIQYSETFLKPHTLKGNKMRLDPM